MDLYSMTLLLDAKLVELPRANLRQHATVDPLATLPAANLSFGAGTA